MTFFSVSVKVAFLLVFSLILVATPKAQSTSDLVNLLGIERSGVNGLRSFTFKPQTRMILKEFGKEQINFLFYEVTDSALIINNLDTIQFESIEYLKGRVYGNNDRKIAGALIAVAAFPASFFPLFIVAYGGGGPILMLLTATPFVGMLVAGLRLTGVRKFKSSVGWSPIIIVTTNLSQSDNFIDSVHQNY